MTVTTTENYVIHLCDGVNKSFPTTDFILNTSTEVEVYLLNIETGVQTLLTTADYSIPAFTEQQATVITYPSAGAAAADGFALLVLRTTDLHQQATATNQTAYNAKVAMAVWDKIHMVLQDQRRNIDLSPKLPFGSTPVTLPVPAAGALLMGTLTGWVNGPTGDSIANAQANADRAEAALAAFAGTIYESRAIAEASEPPAPARLIWVMHDEVACLHQRKVGGSSLTTLSGTEWAPAEGHDSYLQHWGITTQTTKELARIWATNLLDAGRTLHQAAIEAAYLDAEGDLVTNGWVEAFDMPTIGPRCVPRLLDGVAGEQLEGGFFLTSRFNMSAAACVQGGATGSGSYAPYIKSMSIALDQSPAETAGQIAYDAAMVGSVAAGQAAYDVAIASDPGDAPAAEVARAAAIAPFTVAANTASDAAIPAEIIQYPRPFLGKEAFGVIDTLQVTGVADDPVSWTAPDFVGGSGNPDNIGGWELKKLQIFGVGQDLTIENGFHHLTVGHIDLWVKDATPRLLHYRNRKISPGIARKAMYIGRLDRFECKSLYIFGGGEIEMDKGDGNSITDTIGLTLDGDDNSFLQTSGSTHIPEGYASENTAAPRQKYKMKCAGGRLSVGSEYRMVGDAEAMLDVTAGETRYHGMIHVTDVNSHAVKVSGTGKAIMDGAHFRLENAPWNVGPLEQFGSDAQLIVLDNCTADVRTVVGGVVTYVPIDLNLICKFNDFNVGNYIGDAPRTREAMVLGLGNVVWTAAAGGDDLNYYRRILTNVSSRDGGTGVITLTGTGSPTTTVTALYGDATTQSTRIAADGTYSMVSEAGKPDDVVVLTCVQTQHQYPIKGSRTYQLSGYDHLGNSSATGIQELLGLTWGGAIGKYDKTETSGWEHLESREEIALKGVVAIAVTPEDVSFPDRNVKGWKRADGIKDGAAAASFTIGASDEPSTQVTGHGSFDRIGTYRGRDTVGLFVQNLGVQANLETSDTTFTATTFSSPDLAGADVKVGMIVDVNGFNPLNWVGAVITAIISPTSVSVSPWMKIDGTITTAATPATDSNVKLNVFTKAYGMNCNVLVEEVDEQVSATLFEAAMRMRKVGAGADSKGFDLTNLAGGEPVGVGYHLRGDGGWNHGFKQEDDCDIAFYSIAAVTGLRVQDSTGDALRTVSPGGDHYRASSGGERRFTVNTDGDVSRMMSSLVTLTASATVSDETTAVVVTATGVTLTMPPITTTENKMIFVRNASSGDLIINRGNATTYTQAPGVGSIYINRDGTSWYSLINGMLPMDSIVEGDINANGSYVQFADGTQICWNNLFATANGVAAVWTFPMPFFIGVERPAVLATGRYSVARIINAVPDGTGGTSASIYSFDVSGGAGVTPDAALNATGRWK